MSGVISLARTSLAGGSAGINNTFQTLLRTPTFRFLHRFFSTWLKVDITTLAALLTVYGVVSAGIRDLHSIALKIYWYITRFFTASVSIAGNDRLNKEILGWLGANVLIRQNPRIVTARSETVDNKSAWYTRLRAPVERNDYTTEKRVPVQYLPAFGTTWFIHDRNIFLIRRIAKNGPFQASPEEYVSAPDGDEPLVVTCLGRSVEPIKRFLGTCRDFADKQRESYVTVRACKSEFDRGNWDVTILRPIRPLDTIHFDEATKAELIADIKNYLNPATRKFYTARGIPYRRGYLLHGPPGTGKTSLSLGLAGYFGLELYLVHMPTVHGDTELEKLFSSLPPRCFILLEDIDAVGMKRPWERFDDDNDDSSDDDGGHHRRASLSSSRCTLSGLLNVLDGVASQEGRIVLMTSNFADRLDGALVRPGRIDKMIYLGNISQRSALLMFLRMYAPDRSGASSTKDQAQGEKDSEELVKLASRFGCGVPNEILTPAQLQGYLLKHRNSPTEAVEQLAAWVVAEIAMMEEAARRAKAFNAEMAKRRKKRNAR
ncbi:P-loop containing nucleoside triphosphate hydrolase protein [Pleurostoma richardsiae]|uniref:P-loop containing nucleoside triphosphate hydrolase protein n=1 Tax=Pleurostoma richardsiae TaxID=41990 RepID=A0AA38RIM2_9PEZI|nr:P-loop containing nucleoside triphosphate hydrolase protein [Pleurostoma richardsiae]